MDGLAFGLAVVGTLLFVAALANTSPGASWKRVLALGIFADRSQFNPKGWWYRNASLGLVTVALAIFIVLFFVE